LRRRGIATTLFAATYAAAQQRGYEKFFSYVRADNDAALQTYLRHGFRVVGTAERHAKIDGRYIEEIIIEKTIDVTRSEGRSYLAELPRREASGDGPEVTTDPATGRLRRSRAR
jgi:ribosomal protein S18 acetylase RimI-like enzyme